MSERLNEREVEHARKPHVCDWCLRRIEPGEPYRYSFVVDGCDSYPWHECFDCVPYVDELMHEDEDYAMSIGYTTSEFIDWMHERHPGVLPHRKEES